MKMVLFRKKQWTNNLERLEKCKNDCVLKTNEKTKRIYRFCSLFLLNKQIGQTMLMNDCSTRKLAK